MAPGRRIVCVMTAASIDLFLAVRPYYDPAHVREVAAVCESAGIPFCRQCVDWHEPDDPHSED